MDVLAFSGKAGAGKDTAAGFVQEWAEHHGIKVYRDAFANRLKVSAAAALGFRGDVDECVAFCNALKADGQIEVSYKDDNNWRQYVRLTGREYLQFYGTEAHRDVFGSDFWVDALLKDYSLTERAILVLSDCRFPNEAEAVRVLAGHIWNVVGRQDEGVPQHVSETEDLYFDTTIDNSGSTGKLKQTVFSLCMELYNTEPRYA